MIKNLEESAGSDLKYTILGMDASTANKRYIYGRFLEYSKMTDPSERQKMRVWLNWAIGIPHNKIKTPSIPGGTGGLDKFLSNIYERLDAELYGMTDVKEQIMMFIFNKIRNPKAKMCSLGLIGPPGVGKTRISRLLADVMDYPFEQISMGGVTSADYLNGHEYLYVGAGPGEIVKCLSRMGYKNGIIFMDEVEKCASNPTNDGVGAALLHITDPSQNSEFKDSYLSGVTIDLSAIWFVYSMNSLPADRALADRIFTVTIPGYTIEDKVAIVDRYLLPKAIASSGLKNGNIVMPANVVRHIVTVLNDPLDTGVRAVEKTIRDIVSKMNFMHTFTSKSMSFGLGKKIKWPHRLTVIHVNKLCGNV
jgi:ATP-dependent Lon protease